MPDITDTPPYKDYITLALALIGSILGIYNAWRAQAKDKIYIKVEPINWMTLAPNGSSLIDGMTIKVTNLGFLPVTISEVGFRLNGKMRLMTPSAGFLNGQKLPHLMAPRTTVSIHIPPEGTNMERFAEVIDAYANTECGLQFTGKSKALKQRVATARERNRASS